MGTLKSRINQLIEVRERQLPVLMKNRADGQKDLDGSSSNAYAGTVRFLAIARYAAKSDILAIKEGLAAVASVRLDLINRFDAGEPISPSYAAMLTYKALLGALASGDMVIARLLAARMGGRDELESTYDRSLDRALGYTLKYVVLNDEGSARSWLAKFELLSAAAGDSTFHGFEDAFRGILERSLEKVKHGISAIVGQHSPLCRAGSLFHQTEDELLSVWGIGMANLALSYGFRVESNGPLIPANLLIEAGRMRV